MGPSDTTDMLPYLPPSELAPGEKRECEQEYRSWGEYLSSSTNSLDQFVQTYSAKKKASRRKSRTSSNQLANPGEDSPSSRPVEPAQSRALKTKSSKTIGGTAPSVITQTEVPVPVLPTTSKDVENPSSTFISSTDRYVIPKKGIQANRLNELARKVSPPARPILPKPPVMIKTSRPRNTSGSRPNPGQKKKK